MMFEGFLALLVSFTLRQEPAVFGGREDRTQFCGDKHTSLITLVREFSRVDPVQLRNYLVTFVVTL